MIEVSELSNNVAVYYDDLKSVFTSSSASNFDETNLEKKALGDKWNMEIGYSAIYIVNYGTEDATYTITAKEANNAINMIVGAFAALVSAAIFAF